MKGFLSKIPIFISIPSKWGSFFLLVIMFSVPMAEAIPSFQKLKKDSKFKKLKKEESKTNPKTLKKEKED